MHKARIIEFPEKLAHLVDDIAAKRFIAAAPNENARMVLVALVGGIDPIQQHRQPVHPIARQHIVQRLFSARHHVPNAVRLHVVLINHIQPQLVA